MEETFTIQRVVDIVRKMRKVTYVGLPNDPDDVRREVTDLKILEDGTLRAYLKGEKYPVRFFTPQETVNIVSVYKRIFSSFLKKGLVGIIIILISQKVWREWFERIFNAYPILLKEEHYSQPVKEIRRILKIEPIFKDAITLILENDMAYRYRMQDILGEINKVAFNKNPIKELKRLLDLMIERDDGYCRDIWKKARKFIWLLRFYGLKDIKQFVNDLNIKEVKLSVEDIYWTSIVPSYNYRGFSYKERLKQYTAEKESIVNQ